MLSSKLCLKSLMEDSRLTVNFSNQKHNYKAFRKLFYLVFCFLIYMQNVFARMTWFMHGAWIFNLAIVQR